MKKEIIMVEESNGLFRDILHLKPKKIEVSRYFFESVEEFQKGENYPYGPHRDQYVLNNLTIKRKTQEHSNSTLGSALYYFTVCDKTGQIHLVSGPRISYHAETYNAIANSREDDNIAVIFERRHRSSNFLLSLKNNTLEDKVAKTSPE